MKTKTITKFLGIFLMIVILVSFLVPVVPVVADAGGGGSSWSNVGMPQFTVGTNANVFTIAPDGNTIYLFTAFTPGLTFPIGSTKLFKSVDAGKTWNNSGLDTTGIISSQTIKGLAINPASASEMIAWSDIHLYHSINSGQTWTQFDPPTLRTPIYSADIAHDFSSAGSNIVVGYTGGLSLYSNTTGSWNDLGVSTDGWEAGTNAIAVAFSPNYVSDSIVIAVGNQIAKYVLVKARGNSFKWNTTIKDVTINPANTSIPAVATAIASIAFPSDYSYSSSRVFIGIGDTAATPNSAVDVYRITGSLGTSLATALGIQHNPSSISYTGTAAAGTLATGLYNGLSVFSTTNANSASPTWASSNNNPTGMASTANTRVKFSPTSTRAFSPCTPGLPAYVPP